MTLQESLTQLVSTYAVAVESANDQRRQLIATLDELARLCNGVDSSARFLSTDFRHRNYHQYRHEELLDLAWAVTKVLELGSQECKECKE